VQDLCKLAMSALQEPKDEAYAKELLDSAEGDCSLPYDYISVAEVYAKMGNKESAEEMYEEAEDACFEPLEIATLGNSINIFLGDKEKAKELLESAAKDVKKINEILAISNFVQAIGDADLAKTLLTKVEGQCKELKDYKNLAISIIKDTADKETAKAFFKKAENKIDGIPETVEYALAIVELFDDKEMAKEALENVEDDAQFTKDCVQLAKGFLALGDSDKAKEMLENGQQYAMTGEEHIELATGYWELFKDKDLAAKGYEKGLNDIGDKDKLLAFAKTIAVDMGNVDLAKKFYQRAESKTTGAANLSKLAQAVIDDLKDKDYARGIYERAEQNIEQPGELMILAGDIITNLDDKAKAKQVFENAFARIDKFPVYLELFDNVVAKLADNTFGKDILLKAETIAANSPELLQVVAKSFGVLKDMELSKTLLEKAEEVVTNLPEMKDVTAKVKEIFADDATWIKRVDEKLDKREKNQEKYDAYQKREVAAKTFKELRLIVEEMMAELDDKYYAQKLLRTSLELLKSQQFNIDNYRKLIQTIEKYLGDKVWIIAIMDYLIENKAQFFFDYCGICHLAVDELSDGKEMANKYLKLYETKLTECKSKTPYNYTDLAKAVEHFLGDKAWAIKLLDSAEALNPDLFAYAYMGYMAKNFGEESLSSKYYSKAVANATTASQFVMLAERLKALKVDTQEIKDLYAEGSKLTNPNDKLIWAEGIVDLFGAKKWAGQIYSQIASNFRTDEEKELFEISKKIKLEGKFW
jgi:Tfp pilus assembly protein PilF